MYVHEVISAKDLFLGVIFEVTKKLDMLDYLDWLTISSQVGIAHVLMSAHVYIKSIWEIDWEFSFRESLWQFNKPM